jgi:hypothetical protein
MDHHQLYSRRGLVPDVRVIGAFVSKKEQWRVSHKMEKTKIAFFFKCGKFEWS